MAAIRPVLGLRVLSASLQASAEAVSPWPTATSAGHVVWEHLLKVPGRRYAVFDEFRVRPIHTQKPHCSCSCLNVLLGSQQKLCFYLCWFCADLMGSCLVKTSCRWSTRLPNLLSAQLTQSTLAEPARLCLFPVYSHAGAAQGEVQQLIPSEASPGHPECPQGATQSRFILSDIQNIIETALGARVGPDRQLMEVCSMPIDGHRDGRLTAPMAALF